MRDSEEAVVVDQAAGDMAGPSMGSSSQEGSIFGENLGDRLNRTWGLE